MFFSFSFVAKKRERKERKERENTLPLPTLLRALDKMDVASRACTFALTIAANRCTFAARLSFDLKKVNKTLSPTPPPREGTKVAQLTQITPSLGGGCRRQERVLLTSISSKLLTTSQKNIFGVKCLSKS